MNLAAWIVVGGTLFVAVAARAHPPGADGHHDSAHTSELANLRAWTSTKTSQTVRGAFLAARAVGDQVMVSIEREDGGVATLALDELDHASRDEAEHRIEAVKTLNAHVGGGAALQQPAAAGKPPQAAPFDVFAPFVSTRWDDRWLYVESDGLPHVPGAPQGTYSTSHTLMVGITAWQQQVPLPQEYRGDNAWRIPLKPELADKPVSAKEQLFRGAIALAANGVPIFNPIKNDGRTDTLVAGELDEFGGHCGRADDYHYHIAPTHLQKFVGSGRPIAYALDGYPIYGYFDPAAKPGSELACPLGCKDKLDELNGHGLATDRPAKAGTGEVQYHYHASAKYPYLNGGMRGKVTVRDDQIDPQPRATPVRDWLQPLRGAKITGFKATGKPDERAWSLEYTVGGKPGYVNYRIEGEGRSARYIFEFIAPDGTRQSSTYTQGRGPGEGRDGGGDREQPRERRRGNGEGRGRGDRPPQAQPQLAPAAQPAAKGTLVLSSPDVTDGRLNVACTCDGASRSPSLTWNEPPAGTKAFAVVMHHVPPDGDAHVYMVVTDIPATARELKTGDRSVGRWGQNTVNRRAEYAPPCSKGPGDKLYTVTLFALSSEPRITGPLTRSSLLEAVKDMTLATATLDVTYARPGGK